MWRFWAMGPLVNLRALSPSPLPPPAPGRAHEPELRGDPGEAALPPHPAQGGAAAAAGLGPGSAAQRHRPPRRGRAARLHQQHRAQARQQRQGRQARPPQTEEEGRADPRSRGWSVIGCCAARGRGVTLLSSFNLCLLLCTKKPILSPILDLKWIFTSKSRYDFDVKMF